MKRLRSAMAVAVGCAAAAPASAVLHFPAWLTFDDGAGGATPVQEEDAADAPQAVRWFRIDPSTEAETSELDRGPRASAARRLEGGAALRLRPHAGGGEQYAATDAKAGKASAAPSAAPPASSKAAKTGAPTVDVLVPPTSSKGAKTGAPTVDVLMPPTSSKAAKTGAPTVDVLMPPVSSKSKAAKTGAPTVDVLMPSASSKSKAAKTGAGKAASASKAGKAVLP